MIDGIDSNAGFYGAEASSLLRRAGRCPSFTRAAERVHVTQSTLSHQIRQLEEEIGQPLFDRIGKKVVTTEAGELFLAFAARALKEVDQGIAMLKPGGGGLTGQVRIGATHTFNIGLIPECVALFLARHPTVQVRVEELAADQIAAKLHAGELDLGIAYRPSGPTDLWFEPLYNEEMVLVVSTTHPLAGRKRIRMVELHQQRLVLLPAYFATRDAARRMLQGQRRRADGRRRDVDRSRRCSAWSAARRSARSSRSTRCRRR